MSDSCPLLRRKREITHVFAAEIGMISTSGYCNLSTKSISFSFEIFIALALPVLSWTPMRKYWKNVMHSKTIWKPWFSADAIMHNRWLEQLSLLRRTATILPTLSLQDGDDNYSRSNDVAVTVYSEARDNDTRSQSLDGGICTAWRGPINAICTVKRFGPRATFSNK